MKETILTFLIAYVVLFIIYIVFFYFKGKKHNSILNSIQVEFLKIRFEFKNKELNSKTIGIIICILDPLIISLTGTIVSSFKMNYILQLLIGFVLLMAFIFSFYEILGRIINKKIINKKKRKDDKNV